MTLPRNQPDSREFERLVARIEESIASKGAVVKSPDQIRDIATKRLRQVDASIRFRLGSVDILIIIECQRRGRKADVTWIEELATRRQNLGAAKIIAVSGKGFTKSAYITAKQHSIELRTLSEILPQDIEGWFLQGEVLHAIPSTANVRCSVTIEGGADYIEIGNSWERLFFHDLVKSPFSAMDLWAFHEIAHPRRFSNIPRDGSVTRVEFAIDATSRDLIPMRCRVLRDTTPPLLMELDKHRTVIKLIRFSADVKMNIVPFDSADGKYYAYEETSGLIAQHARFNGEAFGLPVTFDLVAQASDISGVAEFPSGACLELVWMENISGSAFKRETCAFCDVRVEMKPQVVLPDFLAPTSNTAQECFLCTTCARRFQQWDAYCAEIWSYLPEDLTGAIHDAFSLKPIDGALVRLWLLSLLWRMGASQALSMVELGKDADILRSLLREENPGQVGQYPVACTALSCEGKRVQFFYPPQWGLVDGRRVLSIVLQGVLFNFLVDADTTDGTGFITDDEWVFPIVDWRKISFLVEEALKLRVSGQTRR